MQDVNWQDLKFLLALSRSHSFHAAGTRLGVDGTTVARRVRALECALGAQLVFRVEGTLRLTDAGQSAVRSAQTAERELLDLEEQVRGEDARVRGRVLVTAVPVISNRILIPSLPAFAAHHPFLEIELLPDIRDVSLMAREADVAVRLARPRDGGHDIKAKRIGTLSHGIYVARSISQDSAKNPVWVSYRDAMTHLPQAKWINAEVARTRGRISNVRLNDFDGMIEAIASGVGRGVLPRMIGDTDPRLRLVAGNTDIDKLTREVWLMTRSDMAHFARVRVVSDWLERMFS